MRINFASTRLAFFLIVLLLLFMFLSAIIPQKDIASGQITDVKENLGKYYVVIEKLKLDEIYTAPYFFIVLGLLATNIIMGNIKRFRTIYKTEKTLIKARYLGSILFHFSLVLIMLGVILNYLYKFEGVYGITERQTVADEENSYSGTLNGPFYEDEYDRFRLKLNEVDVSHSFEGSTTTGVHLTLYQPYSKIENKVVLTINKPYSFNDIEFHYGLKDGYSPELFVTDSIGKTVFRSFMRVSHHKENDISKHYDYIILEKLNIRLSVEVLPDSGSFDSTLFKIKVDNHDEILYESIVKLNETVEFDQYNLTIPRLRRWCYISVVKSPYLSLVFWGFWLAIAGMTISFIPRIIGDMRNR